jgi:HlyD family secretion protein
MRFVERFRPVLAHRRFGAVAGLVLGTIALAAGGWIVGQPAVDVVVMQPRDLVRSVVASGHVEAPHRVGLGATIVATVKRVAVIEGDRVEAGQVLVELVDAEALAQRAQAEAAEQQARWRLRQLDEVDAPVAEQALAQAEVTLAHAQRQLGRDEALLAQGFIGPAAVDDSRKAVELAQSQRDAARRQRDAAASAGTARAIARLALDEAQAAARAARAREADRQIVAPVAGTIIDRSVEPGDVVQPGRVLLTLSPSGGTQLVLLLDEKHLASVAVGQSALASADAFPDERFAARVAEVSPEVDVQRGAVQVKLDVPVPPGYLRQDMTVSVDIAVDSRRDTLVVPPAAVGDAATAHPWVLRVVDGRIARTPVATGLDGAGGVEIVRGLNTGDRVIVRADGAPANGHPARARVVDGGDVTIGTGGDSAPATR